RRYRDHAATTRTQLRGRMLQKQRRRVFGWKWVVVEAMKVDLYSPRWIGQIDVKSLRAGIVGWHSFQAVAVLNLWIVHAGEHQPREPNDKHVLVDLATRHVQRLLATGPVTFRTNIGVFPIPGFVIG